MDTRSFRHWLIISLNFALVLALFISFISSYPVSTGISTAQAQANTYNQPDYTNPTIQETAALINSVRTQQNLPPLSRSETLDKIAGQRALDMQTNGYYGHVDKAGNDFGYYLKSLDSSYSYACENLNITNNPTPYGYVDSWLTSTKGHKECILTNSHTQAGYAVATLGTVNGIGLNQQVIVAIYSD